jgi:hypothetical protein
LQAFGPALSKATAAGYVLPALLKSKFCALTKWY